MTKLYMYIDKKERQRPALPLIKSNQLLRYGNNGPFDLLIR